MRRMEHVGDCLRKFLRGANLDKRVSEWSLIMDWPRIVGPEIAAHSQAHDLREGTLWVAVPSSNWRQHISFLKPQILRALHEKYPEIPVRDIRCTNRKVDLPVAEDAPPENAGPGVADPGVTPDGREGKR